MKIIKNYMTSCSMVLLMVFFVAGCASPAIKTGYIKGYEGMTKGRFLENYWENTTLLSAKKYEQILIGTIDVSKIKNQEGVSVADCKKWLEENLKSVALALDNHLTFNQNDIGIQARLDIAMTEMNPGSVAGRFWAAEFGVGHAWVQVEGRVVDLQTNEDVIRFADRRRSSGALGIRDLGGDVGPQLIREMLQKICMDLANELKKTFGI